jgi:hypothetical protein
MNTHIPGRASLMALPAAISLAALAQAQNVTSVSQNNGVNLATYGAGPVSIASGVSITSTGWAAVWGQQAQLATAGTVQDDNGAGIYLGAGSTLSNSGSIAGADAVQFSGSASVSNSGVISASGYGVLVNNGAGSVANTGTISAGYDGVSLNRGGRVTNSGSISGGHIGVYTGYGMGSVSNSGVISARTGDAVSLYTGGIFTNTATGRLLGGYSGVYAGGNGSMIQNAGTITAPEFGVYLTGASSVSNTGTITGGVVGVIDTGSGAVIDNTGLISGTNTGVKLAANAELTNSGTITGGITGVRIGNNGTLTNHGVIQGGTVGLLANGAANIVNTGIITAENGGDAISLNGGASTLALGTGSVINGDIAGNGTASDIDLTGTGTLASDVTGFGAGGALNVEPGADWVGSGTWSVALVTNNGTLTPGLVNAPLTIDGDFTQTDGGTLRVDVTPGGIAPFTVNGTARLAGTLVYVLAPGSYTSETESFLSASGGIDGGFSTVTSSGGTAATTTNNSKTDTSTVVTSSGTTQTQPVSVVSAGTTASIVISQSFTVAPSDSSLFPNMTQALALGAQADSLALLNHAATGGRTACQAMAPHTVAATANAAAALAGEFCAVGGWAQTFGTAVSADGTYNLRGGGFLAGVDRPVYMTGLRLGLAAGYDTENLRDKSSSRVELDAVRIGLYASQPIGRFLLSANVMDSIVSTNDTRQTGAGGAFAKGNANIVSGAVQIAALLRFQGASVTPAFGVVIDSVNMGSLSETAATQAFAVSAAASNGATVAPYMRLNVAKTFITAKDLAIIPALSLGMTESLSNPGNKVTLTAQDGTNFTASPHHLAPFSGQVAASLAVGRGDWAFTTAYSANLAGNWTAQAVQAGVVIRF